MSKHFLATVLLLSMLIGIWSQNEKFSASAAATKPLLVVLVYDEACKVTCSVVRPVVRELTAEQSQHIDYVELNTGASTLQASLQRASELSIKRFVEDRTDQVPLVGLFCCSTGKPKLLKELVGFKNRDVYRETMEKCLEKSRK